MGIYRADRRGFSVVVIATEEINGVAYEFSCSPDGKFMAYHDGDRLEASTLHALVQRLKSITKPRRVAVPATFLDHTGRAHAITLTGIHATNKNILFRRDGSKAVEQHGHYASIDQFLLPLTDVDRNDLAQLRKACAKADLALEQWLTNHRMNPKVAIEKATAAGAVDPVAGVVTG